MNWVLIGIALLLTVAGTWLFMPTLRLIGRPDFEPAPKDDASVLNATMTRMVDGGQ